MPATDPEITITKLVTVHPHNPAQGRPSIQAEVLVVATPTGERLCWLDGAAVTARRTAALSLLAAQHLAPTPTGPLLLVGAGVQARAHLDAFAEGLGIQEVYIASRTPAARRRPRRLRPVPGRRRPSRPRPRRRPRPNPPIVTATTSRTPVLPPTVREDAFIAAIGAYQPDRAELPPALVHAAAHLIVDTLEGAQAEAGDLLQAGVDWTRVQSLAEALDHPAPPPAPSSSKASATPSGTSPRPASPGTPSPPDPPPPPATPYPRHPTAKDPPNKRGYPPPHRQQAKQSAENGILIVAMIAE